jgi:hypothetical protein
MQEELEPGDYVLATKWGDGDPCDHFVVGFISNPSKTWHNRFLVEDSKGTLFRHNGFRRAEAITEEEGRELLSIFPEIGDREGPSLWEHLDDIRKRVG